MQYLLIAEHIVKNAYLANVFQKPEGWMETPQVSAEAADPQKDYAIDREMEHSVDALK